MEDNTKLIDCLIICVKNKLFGSVKNPHERMHQPDILKETLLLKVLWSCRDVNEF
jgi:hypothetical protein